VVLAEERSVRKLFEAEDVSRQLDLNVDFNDWLNVGFLFSQWFNFDSGYYQFPKYLQGDVRQDKRT
jgi:hypothetical protein